MSRLASLTLAAVCALATLTPAHAATIVYSGSNCFSDGSVSLTTNGALHNMEPGAATTTKLHCPLQRTAPPFAATGVSVRINVLRNLTGASWDCVLRSVDRFGHNIDSAQVFVPPWSGTGSNAHSVVTSTVSAPFPAVSYSLRCNMPDRIGGLSAAIISYEVSE